MAGTTDYRSGTTSDPEGKSAPRKGKSDAPREDADRRWWDKKGKQCSDAMARVVEFLQKQQDGRLRGMVRHARMYGNLGALGVGTSAFGSLLQSAPLPKKFATFNATQSAIDTLTSHVGETKPRPYYLTSGGDYKLQRQAKKLTQFTDGVFYETKAYRKGPMAFRDGAVWGDGFTKVFVRGGKICTERKLGAELWVDELEAQYGQPRNLYDVKVVDRDELAAYFPECREAIMSAMPARELGQGGAARTLANMVTVVEGWHLGAVDESGKMKGGKVATALVGGPMLEECEEWPHDFFPFARFPWCPALLGFWSQGGVEQVAGKQLWMNELYWTIQKAMRLSGTIKVAMEHGSKLVDEHINNEIGAILKHAPGKPPIFFTSSPVDPSFFAETRQCKEDIYEQLGVSQLSATNQKPAGLDSKPALREYKDTQNERHKTTAEAYDDYYLQLAHMSRCLARDIKGYKVRVPGTTGFREINFDDLKETKDENVVLQMFPVSSLPREPAGRTQTIQEWVQAGWITPRQGRKLMDFPDLQSANSLADAQEELITETLDAIVDDGKYRPPEPTDDLALCKETVLHYIALYRRLDLEPEKLGQLRQWNAQVDGLMKKMLAPAAAPMAPGGAPQGSPAAPPPAELLPQA